MVPIFNKVYLLVTFEEVFLCELCVFVLSVMSAVGCGAVKPAVATGSKLYVPVQILLSNKMVGEKKK